MDKFSTEQLTEYFDFLDELRESGVTNMFGATPYIKKEFGLSRDGAEAVLKSWMRTFKRDVPANERAANATEGQP